MTPLRIAFLTTEYVTESTFDGGLANYLHRVCLALTARGHSVEVFCSAQVNETITHAGITVHRVRPSPRLYSLLSRLTRRRMDRVCQTVVTGWALRIAFLQRHRTHPFDLVQAASYLAAGLGLAYGRPVPMAVRLSCFEPLRRASNSVVAKRPNLAERLEDLLERFVLRHCDGVYAPSAWMASVIERDVGVETSVLRPPFMIEVSAFDRSMVDTRLADVPYMLFFGSINRLKGCLALAEALAQVLPEHPTMHFVLVGKTEPLPGGDTVLDRIVERAGDHASRIHYLGQLPHSQLYPVIAGAHAVVLPSLVDNLPNTCLEAMGLKRVVIGTRGTSFEELIEDGKSGVLVPPNDVSGLADAMTRVWLMSDTERERLGAAAHARVAEFDPERTCAVLEDWYRALL